MQPKQHLSLLHRFRLKANGDQGSVPGGAAPLASVMSHDALYVCAASWYKHFAALLSPVRMAFNQPSNWFSYMSCCRFRCTCNKQVTRVCLLLETICNTMTWAQYHDSCALSRESTTGLHVNNAFIHAHTKCCMVLPIRLASCMQETPSTAALNAT